MAETEDRLPAKIFNNSSIHDFEFCRIYFEAGKKLLDFEERSNADYLNRYYEIFSKYFNIYCAVFGNPEYNDHDREIIKLLKESLYYRIIYVLRYSPILSSAVAFHFQNILKEDFNYLRKVMTKKKVKICSVGGGAASDVVAVVKILESLAVKMANQLDFRITVIDSDAKWKNTCLTVLSCLKSFRRATWKIKFIEADISDKNSFSEEVVQSIREADIVLMVMFLYEFINENLDAKDTVKNISELMQCGSMLFLLDLDLIEYIKSCFGLSGEAKHFHLVYENLSDFHLLKEAASQVSYIKYSNLFANLKCSSYQPVFVRAWIKKLKEVSHIRTGLQHRFEKDICGCNPEKTFLDHDFFESWLIKCADRKKRSGWNESSIDEFLQGKRQNRIFYLNKLDESKKMLETARKVLVAENVLLEGHHERNEIDQQAWETFIIQKKVYSRVKKYAYLSFMFDKNMPDFL